jgi:hypothetical protein
LGDMERGMDCAGFGAGAGARGGGGGWAGVGCGGAAGLAVFTPPPLPVPLTWAGDGFGAAGLAVSVGEVIEEGLLSSAVAGPSSSEARASLVLSAATALSRR